jgi:hypothetical protein
VAAPDDGWVPVALHRQLLRGLAALAAERPSDGFVPQVSYKNGC